MRDFDPTASEFITSGYLQRSQPGGVLYDIGSVIGAVAGPVLGGLLGGDASEDAANTQAASADRATQLQKEMFDRQVELQSPFRQAGLAANNKLLELMGLQNPEFMRTTGQTDAATLDAIYQRYLGRSPDANAGGWMSQSPTAVARGIMESAEFKARSPEQQRAAALGSQGSNGEFGSLMRRFSMSDFEADPGYAFRMKEGLAGVESGAAARGGLLSGAAQKALQKYGQGLASQEYGNAYNRFTADQTNQYNRLAGLVNTGQGATNQASNAAANFGQQAGANAIGAGNAIASGQIGQANALVGGINGAYNNIQNNRLMDLIRSPGGTTSTAGMRPSIESYYGY